jgi:hypothetical protein
LYRYVLDWNVKPWLDDGTGGGLDGDGSSMGGGFSGGSLVAGFDEKAEKKQKKKDEREAEKRRAMAEEAAKNAGGPEMSTPEALARLLRDSEDVVVVAAVRSVGALLAGLRGSGGRKLPHEAEKALLLGARKLAGKLTRTAGIVKPRDLPEEVEDDDDALAATEDLVAQLADLARASGSSTASTPRSSRSGSTGTGSRTSGSRSTKTGTGAGGEDGGDLLGGARKPSPMDFALDAPGLLEGLILCTAHASSTVRSAAQEELVEAARGDGVATLAKRLLQLLFSGGDWVVRVKSLEWINSLVSSRLKVGLYKLNPLDP